MENTIYPAIKEAIRKAAEAAADEIIKDCREKFEKEMKCAKVNIVNNLVNTIQISAMQNVPYGEYVIQLRLNGGK